MSPTTPEPMARSGVLLTRADLHAHTRASSRGATGWLDALGVAESYAEPERVHNLARARGMDLVAITDHDTIDGAMVLVERGMPGVIVGEEVTTRLPDEGRTLHVLVWLITPADHEEIGRLGLRDDAVALAHWIRQKRLPHALAHPLFDISGGLGRATLRRCLRLFGGIEAINAGHATARHRAALARFLEDIDAERTAQTVAYGGEPALWPRRWLTAGSDDHALRTLGRAWTAAPGSGHTPESFFRAVMAGEGLVGGRDASTTTLAHQFLSVAGGFARAGDAPAGADGRARRWARAVLTRAPGMRRVLDAARDPTADADADRRRLERASRKAMAHSLAGLSAWLSGRLDRGSNFEMRDWKDLAWTAAPAVLIQAAEIVAASQHAREQRLLRELDGRAGVGRGVCLFVDALDHTSGVSRFVLDLARAAESVHAPLTIFTCARADPAWPANVIPVEPVGSLPAPGYATLRLAVPRIAGLIERCAAIDPAAVHVSTPGPVGLSGLLAARATRAPLVATHHTDLPAYARRLVGSNLAGLAAAKALGWLYARCQRVLVRSSASARDVGALGVAPDRVRVITPGIDLSRFGPGRRDPSVWDGFPGVSRAGLKALCVGRLSAEKDIGALARMWRAAEARLARAGVGAELIVVGDGPGADALRRSVRGSRVRLLGEVRDGRLPAVYASSDLFVFPSRTETLGQVVIEAQASGLPALVSDAGGPAELVRDGVTGLVLDATDADAWALAAAALLTDDNRRRAMGLAAAAHAKRFRFERSFASFWSAHAEVAPLAPVSRAPARAGRGRTRAAATPTPQRGRP